MSDNTQKLSFLEKTGYSGADAAANFVFMTMVLFQLNFYTDTFGLSAGAAAAILLWPRLWDAVADPIVGILADRTNTRWGKFRPWILFTAVPWAVIMVLAYTTPKGWSMAALIAYAAITNTLLMTIYSMNNMPYAALGGVMTGDINERAKLNSFRFIAVNAAQFIVGGFTLPLVAKFAMRRMTGPIWLADDHDDLGGAVSRAVPDHVRHHARTHSASAGPRSPRRSRISSTCSRTARGRSCSSGRWCISPSSRFAAARSTITTITTRTRRRCSTSCSSSAWSRRPAPNPRGGILETLGYIVHGDRANLANSNVADVFNSIINMLGTGLTMIVILLSPPLARKFGKKAVSAAGFALATLGTLAFYLLPPTNVWGMVGLTAFISMVYAPTIPLTWAIFADVADYSEWTTGRRFTGMVFATIGFALKSGLALGSASFLWIMEGFFQYDTKLPSAPDAVAGYRFTSGIAVGGALRHLHRPADGVSAQQAHHPPDGRANSPSDERSSRLNFYDNNTTIARIDRTAPVPCERIFAGHEFPRVPVLRTVEHGGVSGN